MSQIQELKEIPLGPGTNMRLFIDHSKPPKSPGYRWTEVTYEGKPEDPIFEVPPHWHKYHDEILEVLEGELDIHLNGTTMRVRAGDKPMLVPRLQTHWIKGIAGVRSVLKEQTDPVGDFKEWFFRDFLVFGYPPTFFHVMRAFWDGDVYPALPLNSHLIDQAFLLVFGGIAKLVMPAKKPLEKEPWPVVETVS